MNKEDFVKEMISKGYSLKEMNGDTVLGQGLHTIRR